MQSRTLVKKSKKLSWLLRHGALEAGLDMDAAGWVAIDAVLAKTGLTRSELATVVAENNKRRLQVDGQRIRCCQGHSTDSMPVTREALEASWQRVHQRSPLFHGTRLDVLDTILADGIVAMQRTHVHLAHSPHSPVGKRAAVALLLEIDPERIPDGVWVAPNGVVLARFVPPDAIVGVRAQTKRARQQSEALQARLAEHVRTHRP
jgi:putative RNA 2'-phosphotransferase